MMVYFDNTTALTESLIVVPLFEGSQLPALLAEIDNAADGLITSLIKRNRFSGKNDEKLSCTLAYRGEPVTVTLFGMGGENAADARLTGTVIANLLEREKQALLIAPETNNARWSAVTLSCELGFGFLLGCYRFNRYKRSNHETGSQDVQLRIFLVDAGAASDQFPHYATLAKNIAWARDLGNEPPNILYPDSFARHCEELASTGLAVEVLNEKQLKVLGMNALLGVAQGSDHPARCVVLSWRGPGIADNSAPLCLLGKGVTFDSGGMLPKGPEEMWDMKFDMCGAAAVAGSIATVAEKRMPLHVVALLGLVENLPSGKAMPPGAVVRSMSGTTIEVLHTDAEGRLVLADLIDYAHEVFQPSCLIDVATLTGAMTAVLGESYAGLFSNHEVLAEQLIEAGESSGERLWRLPLCEDFAKMLASPIADIQNIPTKRMAGSGTAAQFLNHFAGATPWAHIDIAGVAWAKNRQSARDFGATGFGVRLLDAFFENLSQNAKERLL